MANKRGFTKNGVEFRLENEDMYHYEAFKYGNITSAELRKEYSRLRQTANKRLQRMEGTRFEKSQTYLKNAGKYTTIAQMEKAALAHAKNLSPEAAAKVADMYVAKKLADMYKFLTAKTGSIRGMQRVENEIIKTLNERGLTFINKSNIQAFGDFMEYLRAIHKGRMFDSERAAELFQAATKKGVDPLQLAEDFSFWKEHVEELEDAPKIRNPKNRTAEEYRKRLEGKTDRKKK